MQPYHLIHERFPGEHYYAYPPFNASGINRMEITTAPDHPDGIFAARVLLERRSPENYAISVKITPDETRSRLSSSYFRVLLDEVGYTINRGFRTGGMSGTRRTTRDTIPTPQYWNFATLYSASHPHTTHNNWPETDRITRFFQQLPPLLGPEVDVTITRESGSRSLVLRQQQRSIDTVALTKNERYVLSRHYGWEDGVERPLRTIASEMGFSAGRPWMLEMSACFKLDAYHRKVIAISTTSQDGRG